MPAEKLILLRIIDEFVDTMCEVNPEYKRYVLYENGKKFIHVKVPRAIYRCIESAMLCYNVYVNTLKYLGFSINTYDRRMAQKIIYVNQCTIVWYVEKNKLLHVEPNVITDILEEINKHLGYLVISRGDTHDLLGVNIKIRNDNNVKIITKHQIEDTLSQFKYICDFKVTLPCAHHLWDVKDEV